MREVTLEEIESVSGAVLSCTDKWEIGGAILGGILGGWGGAAVGIGAGDVAANIIGC